MYLSFVSSILFHAGIVIIGYFGIPLLDRTLKVREEVIWIELANLADESNAPLSEIIEQEKELKKIPEPEPSPEPVPEPEPSPEPVPEPEPSPEPVPEPESSPEPAPTPKKLSGVKPVPDKTPQKHVKPKKKVKRRSRLFNIKSRRKPEQPNELNKIMKTLEEFKKRTSNLAKKKQPESRPKDFINKMANTLARQSKRHNPQLPISMTDLDRVRQQIRACWNPPPGQANAEEMLIELALVMNPDGTVRTAKISNTSRMAGDPVYRAAADAARRAVLNPKCNPLKLPSEKYSQWQRLLLSFNPKDMY